MKRLLLLVIAFLTGLFTQAQVNGSVRGKLVDTAARQPLQDATISVMLAKDSSLVSFILSDKKGSFEIPNLDTGAYLLLISFSGYENYKRSFSITREKRVADLGELILQKDYKALPGVVVTDVIPVRVDGDTVSFKADAFKTKPNATTEDLLKKLPGVQVQKDGTVSAMGENVQKILVDGKEFFGNDPKMATKNITADMVDQIQVFDDMSEQSKFTKIDDGSRSKTINIKLKKDRNRGDFGKLTAGAGSSGRYQGNVTVNHFRGNQRFSLIGSANNANKQNFSFNDIVSSQGGMGQFSRGGFDIAGLRNALTGGGGGGNNNGVNTSRSMG
jgi:hypothetical protein